MSEGLNLQPPDDDQLPGRRYRLRSGRNKYAGRTLYDSLPELRRHHPKLFDGSVSATVCQRPLYTTERGLLEATVRAPADKPINEATVRTLVKLQHLYGPLEFELSQTLNFILENTRSDGASQYSVWYGQGYEKQGLSVKRKFDIEEVKTVASPADLEDFPPYLDMGEGMAAFEQQFDDSAVTVHEVISQVVVLRTYMTGLEGQGHQVKLF